MPIRRQSADGNIHEIPDKPVGMTDAQYRAAIDKAVGAQSPRARREYTDQEVMQPRELSDEQVGISGPSRPSIRAQAADGTIHEFPAGTDQALIDRVMLQYARDQKPLNATEKQNAAALGALDVGWLPIGDEIVGGLSAAGEFVQSGGDFERAGKAYTDEVAYARQIKRRQQAAIERDTKRSQQPGNTSYELPYWSETDDWDFPLIGKHRPTHRFLGDTLGLVGGALPFEGAYVAGRGAIGLGRQAFGLAPQATGLAGRVVQTGGALAGTGAAFDTAHRAAEAEGGVANRLQAVEEGGAWGPLAAAGFAAATGPAAAGVGALTRATGKLVLPASRRAARYVAERLGKMTPEEFASQQQAAAAGGKPAVLADVGPPGIRQAAGVAAREPGPGRDKAQEVLGGRQEAQVERISDDVAEAAGGKPGTFGKTVDDIAAERSEASRPLYDEAMRAPPLQSPKLTEVVNRPSAKAAMQRGLKMAEDEGIPMDDLIVQTPNGPAYSTKALHYMKLGLDDMISSAQRTGDNSAARALTILRKQLLGEMDRLNPTYAKARSVFAGHAANQSALEAGHAAHRAHPDQIAKEMAGLSEGEREFYRRGFAQRVIQQVEQSPDRGNAVRRIFGNTAQRKRMKAVLGEERYNQLAERMGVEQGMYDTYSVANLGSQTAERQAEAQAMDEAAFSTAGKIATGLAQLTMTGYSGLRSIGLGAVFDMIASMRARMREHIAKLLFSGEPAKVNEAVRLIKREYEILQRQQKAASIKAALAGQQGPEQGRNLTAP